MTVLLLIYDTSRLTQRSLELEKAGCFVVAASDANRAFHCLSVLKYDVLLFDRCFPRLERDIVMKLAKAVQPAALVILLQPTHESSCGGDYVLPDSDPNLLLDTLSELRIARAKTQI